MDQHIDLLPRRLIFGNPERIVVRISHDGTRIAFLAPVDGLGGSRQPTGDDFDGSTITDLIPLE
jgi:hypothetical protein